MISFVQMMRSAYCAVWFFSPVATKLLQLRVGTGRQQIYDFVKVSEGCRDFPGRTKTKQKVSAWRKS